MANHQGHSPLDKHDAHHACRALVPSGWLAIAAPLFFCCGGKAIEGSGPSPHDAGTATEASDFRDAGPLQDATSPDEGSSPIDGSSDAACPYSTTCFFCTTDNEWHCQVNVFPACPAEAQAGGACAARNTSCFSCGTDGGGAQWTCAPQPRDAGIWLEPNPFPCFP
jgi:hypothetical protein